MANKWVYSFSEGNAKLKFLLGGKGANLSEMTNIGLPVPKGFILTTDACINYYNNNQTLSDEKLNQIDLHLKSLEKKTNKELGSTSNPLLISIRSGAAISMPGMMDTILNLGLNDETVKALANNTNNERFAYDSYRRFIQMFSDVACQTPKHLFEKALEKIRVKYNVKSDPELNKEQLIELIKEYKKIHKRSTGNAFPEDPYEQMIIAIKAVFDSWNNKRAITYRKIHNIDDSRGLL